MHKCCRKRIVKKYEVEKTHEFGHIMRGDSHRLQQLVVKRRLKVEEELEEGGLCNSEI